MYGALILLICLGLGIFSYISSSDALKTSIDENLMEMARADAKIVTEKINSQLNALEAWANDPSIKSSEISINEKLALLEVEVTRSGHKNNAC